LEVEIGAPDGPRPEDNRGRLPEVLVEPDWLVNNLESPGTIVLEIARDRPVAGQSVVLIPGARRVYWRDLLWDAKRRDFALPHVLADRLAGLGVSRDTDVVICGDPIQFGTYAYWVLRMMDCPRIRILNGGKELWRALDLPLSADTTTGTANALGLATVDPSTRVGREEVLESLGSDDLVVVDLRSEEEYLGLRVAPPHAADHGAEARGRIPGARHLYYQSLLAPDGRFLGRDEMVDRLQAAGVCLDKPVVLYCRLGHRASLGWFCLSELLGFEGARVYDGSWTEWGSMVGMPVER
jgi:thiosulfate/3-mercaptopyruvate sulfurtransferase